MTIPERRRWRGSRPDFHLCTTASAAAGGSHDTGTARPVSNFAPGFVSRKFSRPNSWRRSFSDATYDAVSIILWGISGT
jgi:hypothetical protein